MTTLDSRGSRSLLLLSYFVVCTVWGSTYFAIRIALEDVPPFMIGAARFLVAGLVLLAWGRARGEPLPSREGWKGATVTWTLFFGFGNGLVNVGERWVSSGMASVLVATMPLWATVFARLSGQRPSRSEALGVAVGLVGVGVLNLGSELRGSPLGTACLLAAPMSWALGTLVSRKLPPAPAMTRTGAQMFAGGAVMLVASLALGERTAGMPGARALLAVLYLCVMGSLVGFSAFAYLLHNTRASFATSYAYVNPVVAVGLGVAFAGERVGVASACGTLLVLAAVVLVIRARGQAPRAEAALPRDGKLAT